MPGARAMTLPCLRSSASRARCAAFFVFGVLVPGEWQVATSLLSNHECLIEITTDLSRIDLDRVHEWLVRKSFWVGQMPRAVFDRAVRGSLCFGALKQDTTVGFARVISDQ